MSLIVPAILVTTEQAFNETLALYGSLPAVERIQIDVVDGRFADPPTWPYTAPKEFRDRIVHGEMLPYLDRIEYEIDLMCFDIEEAAAQWLAYGASRLTIHIESTLSLPQLLASVRRRFGHIVSLGLAISVTSDIALLGDDLSDVSYVQFMGIARIGRQGQPFDTRVLEQIHTFRRRNPDLPFQVDGGVSFDSAKKLVSLGTTNLVMGSGILRADDPAAALATFNALKQTHRS